VIADTLKYYGSDLMTLIAFGVQVGATMRRIRQVEDDNKNLWTEHIKLRDVSTKHGERIAHMEGGLDR
jgi:hypothetical protein